MRTVANVVVLTAAGLFVGVVALGLVLYFRFLRRFRVSSPEAAEMERAARDPQWVDDFVRQLADSDGAP